MKNGKYNSHKKSNIPVFILAGLTFAIATIVLLINLVTESTSKVDPFEYIAVSYTGYDGNGAAKLNFQKIDMIEIILMENQDPNVSWLLEYDIYDRGINVEVHPEENLSNGDTVTVTVSVSKNAGKKVKDGKKEFTVEGLPEAKSVDILANVQLYYEGIGDLARARLERTADDELMQSCRFNIEPEYGIHNGDTVTVTLENPEQLTAEFLCIPKESSKTFTVSGLDEYLADSELLPETQIKDIITRFLIETAQEDSGWFSYSEPEYYKTFFFTPQEGSFFTEANVLEIYVCYDKYLDGEFYETIYTPIVFRDMIVHPDGSTDLDYENGSNATFYTDPDAILDKDGYDVEEIYIEY